jgi:hypothetical protein
MSHFAEIRVNALTKNEKDLVAALQKHFGDDVVEVHKDAVPLHGMDQQAGKKAHLVVRKANVKKGGTNFYNSAYNDFGFERKEDGTYTWHVDDMDVPVKTRNSVMQDYAERVSTRQLKAKGYMVKRQVLKDGTVKLVATRYA